jgi:hypothetical protein
MFQLEQRATPAGLKRLHRSALQDGVRKETRMWRLPVAFGEPLTLVPDASPISADTRFKRGAELLALGGAAAVMAAADKNKAAADDQDDWSGGFDIHLGVYTSD